MKKLLIISMLLTFLTVGVYVAKGYCWNCPPKRCTFSIECDVGCFCWKGEYEINGVCVTE